MLPPLSRRAPVKPKKDLLCPQVRHARQSSGLRQGGTDIAPQKLTQGDSRYTRRLRPQHRSAQTDRHKPGGLGLLDFFGSKAAFWTDQNMEGIELSRVLRKLLEVQQSALVLRKSASLKEPEQSA